MAESIWPLDPDAVFLNHGSFGSTPNLVLEAQRRLRARMEAQPVRFFVKELEARMDEAKAELARFIGAQPEDLAFVPNATAGVNSVLRSLLFEPKDEILVHDHAYNACRNAAEFLAKRWRAKVVVARIPFPLQDPAEAVAAVLKAATPRTRIAFLDHVTSPTGLVLPIREIIVELKKRDIECLIDGAHAPGMIELNLEDLGAAYYAGNCHKWLCAPKGAAFLHVRKDFQEGIVPTSISHGFNSTRKDRSRYQLLFDWTGTDDPTPFLCVPDALKLLGGLYPGGWPELRERNRALALNARDLLCKTLGVPAPAPDSMLGAMAAVPLPDGDGNVPDASSYEDALHEALWAKHKIEVPIVPWPAPPKRLVRVSAQSYNSYPQYERLARALAELLALPAKA